MTRTVPLPVAIITAIAATVVLMVAAWMTFHRPAANERCNSAGACVDRIEQPYVLRRPT